jgi:hypothetical protein
LGVQEVVYVLWQQSWRDSLVQDVVVEGVHGKDNVMRVGEVAAFPKEVGKQQVVQVVVGVVVGMLTG